MWAIKEYSKHIYLIAFYSEFKAYAEIESDTPGSIHGVTNTKEGKSSKRKPQGETDSAYKEHDRSEEYGYWEGKAADAYQRNVMIGILLVAVILYFFLRRPGMSVEEQTVRQYNLTSRPSASDRDSQDP